MVHSVDMPTRHQEIAYHIMLRRVWTGERVVRHLANADPPPDARCCWCVDAGTDVTESLEHMFVTCPPVVELWKWLFAIYAKFTGVAFVPTEQAILCGVRDPNLCAQIPARPVRLREERKSVWATVRGIALASIRSRRDGLRSPPENTAPKRYAARSLITSCRTEIHGRIHRDFLHPMTHIKRKKNTHVFTRWLHNSAFATLRNGVPVCFPP